MTSLMLMLTGATATLALVAALFFLRFWLRTRDSFFLLLALAFSIDGFGRLIAGAIHVSDEFEPYSYLPRLVTFALIIAAVVMKNKPKA